MNLAVAIETAKHCAEPPGHRCFAFVTCDDGKIDRHMPPVRSKAQCSLARVYNVQLLCMIVNAIYAN